MTSYLMNINDLGTMAVNSVVKSSSMLPFYKILLNKCQGKSVTKYIMISNMSVTLKHWSMTQDKYFPLTDP